MNDLRDELSALADRAAPADLLDRVYATSHRLKRRRQALAAGVAGCLVASLFLGSALTGETALDDRSRPLVTPPASGSAYPPPEMKPFLPPSTRSGDRTITTVVLADGTEVRFSHPTDLKLRFADTTTGYNTKLDVQLSGTTVPMFDAQYVRTVSDANGQPLELWREADPEDAEGHYYWARIGHWFVGLSGPVPENVPDPFPELRELSFSVDSRGFLRISGAPLETLPMTNAYGSEEYGPVLALSVLGGEDRSLSFSRVIDCTGADHKLEGESVSRKVCKDGVVIEVYQHEESKDRGWIERVAPALRIESVKTP